MSLTEYHKKRDFSKTREPEGAARPAAAKDRAYLIQKHAARRLHYDFRLQLGDTLKSWAVAKGPSLDPRERRLAVHVEDHPLEYGGFEGVIPQGQYGGGTVMLWDRGTWEPQGDAEADYAAGRLKFILHGERLSGGWMLVRMKPRTPRDHDNWLLIKEHDASERPLAAGDILEERTTSVVSRRAMAQIAQDADRVHGSDHDPTPAAGARARAKAKPAKAKTAAADGSAPSARPAELVGARRAALPDAVAPQLATLAKSAPAGPEWQHEIKFDGYRTIIRIVGGRVTVLTRNGLDWTARTPSLVAALAQTPVETAILDGEITVLDEEGLSSFGALQAAFSEQRSEEMTLYLFDLLYLDGYDLRDAALTVRRAALRALLAALPADGPVRFSDDLADHGPSFFQHSCRFGLEGVVSKRRDAPYRSGRGESWVKTKCINREEFVIGGFTLPGDGGDGVGALLIGYYDRAGALIYVSKVGTGFTQQSARTLRRQLDGLQRAATPFKALPGPLRRHALAVEPVLVAEIEFAAWTEDGAIRHAAFKGLRDDKPAREVTRDDQPESAEAEPAKPDAAQAEPDAPKRAARKGKSASAAADDRVAGIVISHPDRVLHTAQDATKIELARYYAEVADWMLPLLRDRPLSLFRCPGDHKQGCFFQKHLPEGGLSDRLRRIAIAESGGAEIYCAVEDVAGLIALVQYGVIEFHPWGATADDPETADQLIFDFDPAPDVAWPAVIAAALALRRRLLDQGLRSFVKTTGGKGLHVVAPLNPGAPWPAAKAYARGIAEAMAAEDPARYVAVMTKAKRAGRIFIDYLRNGRGATAVAPYSARARAHAPVATPIDWAELTPRLGPDHFTIKTVRRRLDRLSADPWAAMRGLRQGLPEGEGKPPRARR